SLVLSWWGPNRRTGYLAAVCGGSLGWRGQNRFLRFSNGGLKQDVMTPAPERAAVPRERLIDFLGLRRSIVGLLGMVVLVGMGEHMAEQFLPLYLLALGGGFISIGFLNAMDNLLGALYSFPGGYLSDRLGTKRALLVFNIASMIGFVIVVLIPTWQAVLGGAALFLSWT